MSQKINFTLVFTTVMAFAYAALGVYLLAVPGNWGLLSGNIRIAAGILLLVYGALRVYLISVNRRNSRNRNLVVLGVLLLLQQACSPAKKADSTPSAADTVHVYVDETFKPIIEAGYDVFSVMDTIQVLKLHYAAEATVLKALTDGKAVMAIVSRQLEKPETAALEALTFFPKTTPIAIDAIGIVANPSVTDSVLTVQQIQQILSGKITNWKQLNPKNQDAPIRILFDNTNSSIVRCMKDSLLRETPMNTNAFAMDVNTDVIDYVSKNSDVLGFIGVSWLSNRNDPQHLSFHSQIKVMAICNEPDPKTNPSFQPFQAYILDGMYPFTRNIYMINAEPKVGKATRFSNFMAGEKGQRIILKSGILPAVAPTRVVNVREQL